MNKQLHTFTGMGEVKDKYTASGMTDTQFAEQISAVTGQQYSHAQVRAWRRALGITNNTLADERDRLIMALRECARGFFDELQGQDRLFNLEEVRKFKALGVLV